MTTRKVVVEKEEAGVKKISAPPSFVFMDVTKLLKVDVRLLLSK